MLQFQTSSNAQKKLFLVDLLTLVHLNDLTAQIILALIEKISVKISVMHTKAEISPMNITYTAADIRAIPTMETSLGVFAND